VGSLSDFLQDSIVKVPKTAITAIGINFFMRYNFYLSAKIIFHLRISNRNQNILSKD